MPLTIEARDPSKRTVWCAWIVAPVSRALIAHCKPNAGSPSERRGRTDFPHASLLSPLGIKGHSLSVRVRCCVLTAGQPVRLNVGGRLARDSIRILAVLAVAKARQVTRREPWPLAHSPSRLYGAENWETHVRERGKQNQQYVELSVVNGENKQQQQKNTQIGCVVTGCCVLFMNEWVEGKNVFYFWCMKILRSKRLLFFIKHF